MVKYVLYPHASLRVGQCTSALGKAEQRWATYFWRWERANSDLEDTSSTSELEK